MFLLQTFLGSRSLIFWRPFCFIDSYQIYLNGLIEQWSVELARPNTKIDLYIPYEIGYNVQVCTKSSSGYTPFFS